MAVYDKITVDQVFPYGEENAVASFYKWMKDVFGEVYPVYFDREGGEPTAKALTRFSCIVVQQIDTQDLTTSFIGGKNNYTKLLFYIYFNHSLKNGGSRRLLRRGRDQIMTALKLAGVCAAGSTNPQFPPIAMWNFNVKPLAKLESYLTLDAGIQQRFIQEDDTLQQELMVTLKYMERLI